MYLCRTVQYLNAYQFDTYFICYTYMHQTLVPHVCTDLCVKAKVVYLSASNASIDIAHHASGSDSLAHASYRQFVNDESIQSWHRGCRRLVNSVSHAIRHELRCHGSHLRCTWKSVRHAIRHELGSHRPLKRSVDSQFRSRRRRRWWQSVSHPVRNQFRRHWSLRFRMRRQGFGCGVVKYG